MDDKSNNWIFVPTKKWPLGLKELVVYSYLGYRDRFDNYPSKVQLGKSVGLSETGINSALDSLEAKGLWSSGKVVAPPDGWLVVRSEKGLHWSQSLAGWMCYVRAFNSPLTFTEICLWSYLRHCVRTNYVPAAGWTIAFLGHSLCVGRDTVTRCLESLATHGLLEYEKSPLKINVYKTVYDHLLPAFRDKGTYNPRTEGTVGEVDAPPMTAPATLVIDPRYGTPPGNGWTQPNYLTWCRIIDVKRMLIANGMLDQDSTYLTAKEMYVAYRERPDCKDPHDLSVIESAIKRGRWVHNGCDAEENIMSILRSDAETDIVETIAIRQGSEYEETDYGTDLDMGD